MSSTRPFWRRWSRQSRPRRGSAVCYNNSIFPNSTNHTHFLKNISYFCRRRNLKYLVNLYEETNIRIYIFIENLCSLLTFKVKIVSIVYHQRVGINFSDIRKAELRLKSSPAAVQSVYVTERKLHFSDGAFSFSYRHLPPFCWVPNNSAGGQFWGEVVNCKILLLPSKLISNP